MDNFDWEFYLDIYPDVRKNGFNNEKKAKWHYFRYGIAEKRVPNATYMKKNVERVMEIILDEERKMGEKLYNRSDESKASPLINILIRTSSRPYYFNKCMESILNQEYKNYRIIVCYDTEESKEYIEKYNIDFFFIEVNSKEKYKFNLYCNSLMDKVDDGYIMFLDDDDKFTQKYALNIISNNIKSEEDFLIWKFFRPDKVIYPEDINNIKLGEIDTTTICFHSKYKDLARWDNKQYGDYNFYNKLLTYKDINFNKLFIDNILTQTIFDNKVGNFGTI